MPSVMDDSSLMPASPQMAAQPAAKPPVKMRDFDDAKAIRTAIYDHALNAVRSIQPVQNKTHTLSLLDADYVDSPDVSETDHKHAILSGGSLKRRIRGTFQLTDNATNKPIDSKVVTIASIPHYTDDGTFIFNGSGYSLASQIRLLPGVFAREKHSGEGELHFNVAKGLGHRIMLDPKSGLFSMNIGQAKIPLMPILKALGATNEQLNEAWGRDITFANAKKDDPKALDKLADKLVNKYHDLPQSERRQAALDQINAMTLDSEVTTRTLGHPHTNAGAAVYLAATQKLLAIGRGEAESDDRDALPYQRVLGPEDLIAERISKAHQVLRPLLWRMTHKQSLQPLQAGVLDKAVNAAIQHSGLGMPGEQVNPIENLDQRTRITRMGEGGITDISAIPDSSRTVQPSHLNFLDLIRSPESASIGVDLRSASRLKKGDDGRIYAPFTDVRTGKEEWLSPQDVSEKVIGFSDALKSNRRFVPAVVGGKSRYVRREEVDVIVPEAEHSFNHLANLVPFKSAGKAHRTTMGSRMVGQALPLTDAEAPLVQVGVPGSGETGEPAQSYEEMYGRHAGTVHAKEEPGVVVKVGPGGIEVKYASGRETHELRDNRPMNRKTLWHNTPVVQVGDQIKPGQLLAHSNYTDKSGTLALGRNLRVAYVPYRGESLEDAIVVSESAASKKLVSEHAYQHTHEWSGDSRKGKNAYVAAFPLRFDRPALETLDEHGVVKPGTVVQPGAPLVLSVREPERTHDQITRGRKGALVDAALTWDHETPGTVTDSYSDSGRAATVVVKALKPLQVGDKLCFDEETQALTRTGWKSVADITVADEICCLNDGRIEYKHPLTTHKYPVGGRMYRIKSQQIDLLVTEHHRMYVKLRSQRRGNTFGLIEAAKVYGKRVQYCKRGDWVGGRTPKYFTLPAITVKGGQGGVSTTTLAARRVPTNVFAALLGAFLSEGNCFWHPASGSFGLVIHQARSGVKHRAKLTKFLRSSGINFTETDTGVQIFSKQMALYFKQFGRAKTKFIPDHVFGWSKATLKILFEWLMWGDGHCESGRPINYTTISPRLADDVQRLCLHIGYAANITRRSEAGWRTVCGKLCYCQPSYDVRIITTKLTPEVNHGHTRTQHVQEEYFVENYTKPVYCVTVPSGVLYVRRNGLPCWSGNSNKFGGKGVVSTILPDEQMPHDKDGKPMEVLLNSLGLVSRVNANQILEAALGKVANKTGQPYKVQDFRNVDDLRKFASEELRKHGFDPSGAEDLLDPTTGRKIPQVMTGYAHILKLHHTSAEKSKGRSIGGYSADETPSRGGDTGSKRMALMTLGSLLSHNALELARGTSLIRGAKNIDYWTEYMTGRSPHEPGLPRMHQKFHAFLKAAGIHAVPDGKRTHVMALTDKAIDELAGNREVTNSGTVDWRGGLKELPGGLFDPTATGGHGSNQWSFVQLAEPMPSPVFEEPILKVLGLTERRFRDVLAGREELNGLKGPKAVQKALEAIDVDKGIAMARADIESGKKTLRDNVVKRLQYLKGAELTGVHPSEWMLTKVPVLPPVFRPVSRMQGSNRPLVADANYLYKELIEARDGLKDMLGRVDDVGDERLAVYDAFKGVTGLGDPITVKNQARGVKGALKAVLGSSPKHGFVQQKLLGRAVDMVGRAVVTVDADLGLDSIGIPEPQAWEVYRPYIVRRLVRHGMAPVAAARQVKDQTEMARQMLLAEAESRPIVTDRAPVLHRYGTMAFWPKITKGHTIRVNPFTHKGFNLDHDGDAMNFYVPSTDAEVKEVIDKMLPSKNLLSIKDFKAHQLPMNEFRGGLYSASAQVDKKRAERIFQNAADVLRAFKRGEIDHDSRVVVRDE